MGKYLGLLLMCILAESTAAFRSASSSSICHRDIRIFLYDLNSQCPLLNQFSSPPIEVDGETFEKAVSSIQAQKYVAALVYASWCPFSSSFQSKFSTLSSMYPQIQHMMVEQSSAMPSVFSRFGIHSVPSLLVVNQTTRVRYHGQKDLLSLINFYKKSTGLYPMVEEALTTSSSGVGTPPKETFWREPYLLVSLLFVFLRMLEFLFPEMPSRIMALWITYLPRLNLAIFGESRQLLGHVLHVIDIKRIWAKLMCKARNFHKGARNAQVWASSLASVSLGKTASSSRVLPSRDL